MFFLTSFYDHLRFFTAAAHRHGATGDMRIGSMNAVLRAAEREVEFLAQFVVPADDGKLTYSMQYRHDAQGFVGWLPYFNKRWLEAHHKLAFKRRCAAIGLPTPDWSISQADARLGDFLIKSAEHSSFGYGVRGPFAVSQASEARLGDGDYAERFIEGRSGKAWFWNNRVVALELREPASVVGDGHASLAQLVKRVRRWTDVVTTTDFFRYRGLHWDQVAADGERVVVDFKYRSSLEAFDHRSSDRLDELRESPLVAQLNSFGPAFWQWVPPPIRQGTLYTVDFMLSVDDRVWLLEMNCNPMVAPEAYDVIVGAALRGEIDGTDSARMMLVEAPAPGGAPMRSMPPPTTPPAAAAGVIPGHRAVPALY